MRPWKSGFSSIQGRTKVRTPGISVVLIAAQIVFSAGCTRVIMRPGYYLLDYRSSAANPQLRVNPPFPYKVQVLQLKIPRAFDSNRIIARFSSHQIEYYQFSYWAVKPQIAIADLLEQHINAYNLFIKCQREFLDERPNYEITGTINQIERFDSEKYSAVHLNMSFEIYDYAEGKLLLKHEFDRETPIPPGNMTIFAKAASDIISAEAEVFLTQVVTYFSNLQNPEAKAAK